MAKVVKQIFVGMLGPDEMEEAYGEARLLDRTLLILDAAQQEGAP